MAFLLDDCAAGGQFICGAGNPVALGVGDSKIRGSAYVEGPMQVGKSSDHKVPRATFLIGRLNNSDAPSSLYSLWVKLYSRFQNFVRIDILLKCKFIEAKIVRTEVLQASIKNFVIDHPTKEGKKLVHTCLEGPENGVYVRGKLVDESIIELPEYWTKLVDESSISISITPIGNSQDIFVSNIENNKIFLQEKESLPISCFYHIFGTRNDVEKLVTEIDE
jgi:hypothetical protein